MGRRAGTEPHGGRTYIRIDEVSVSSSRPSSEAIHAALATVSDPEIGRPITDLDMVASVHVADDASVDVAVRLTVAGCPMREEITNRVTRAVGAVEGVRGSGSRLRS
jgi:ATP-binding protein involved in chromosome partitioning